ncbi:MAG: hypothetical protein QW702_08805 [Candidatus Bathyarchaeia archaeon]
MATQLELKEPKLPEPFEKYVLSKLENGKKGRKHLVNQLGSMDKVLELLKDVWLENLDNKALEKKYNISYWQIYRFIKEIEPFKDAIIEYIRYHEEVAPKNFREIPIIREWEAKIRRSGKLSMLRMISYFENICNGEYVKSFKCHPNKFDLTKAQEFVDAYLKEHPEVKKLPRHLRQAIRHFLMVAKGINIPRGFGSQYGLSGEKDNFGIYKFVRATEEQIEKVREYLKAKGDLEALVFFDWGIESLARAKTLAKTKMQFIESNGIVETSMFETKTEKPFPKFLLLNIEHARETWEEIKQLGKGREYLFFEDKPRNIEGFLDKMSKRLKEAYRYAGITEEYAYRKPFHFLRHTGAHLWLMRTNYDYGLVAELGWEDINTLRQVYGGMPKEVLANKIASLSHQQIKNGAD